MRQTTHVIPESSQFEHATFIGASSGLGFGGTTAFTTACTTWRAVLGIVEGYIQRPTNGGVKPGIERNVSKCVVANSWRDGVVYNCP